MIIKKNRLLGQHFLNDENTAKKIISNLSFNNYNTVVEVGPGMGMLTKYLLRKNIKLFLIEIDKELVFFLKNSLFIEKNKIINDDFLKWNPENISLNNFAVIGNFPYNISSQILFRIIKYYKYIPECIGTFQKEVAERIVSKKGKKYGILSVLIQTFYDVKYLFTIKNNLFRPIPNVNSGVLYMKRKENVFSYSFNKKLFFKCVKTAFNQRRKKLKNSLKKKWFLNYSTFSFSEKRAEELSVQDFIEITKEIKNTL